MSQRKIIASHFVFLQRGIISANRPADFEYDLKIDVVSFDFAVGNSPTQSVNGNNLQRFYETIQGASSGSYATFTNVVSTATTSSGQRIPNVKVNDFFVKIR